MTHDIDKAGAAVVRHVSSVALKRDGYVIVSSSSGALESKALLKSSQEADLLRSAIRERYQELRALSSVRYRYQKQFISILKAEFDRGERTIKQALSITALSSAAE
jgi:hypothetical protein